MATRNRKEEIVYKRYLRSVDPSVCEFCAFRKGHKQFVAGSRHFKVIRNIFAYSLWEEMGVSDHLMLVPKRHVTKLSDLNREERLDFAELFSKYEDRGYNIYARSPKSITKSIPHQHTHAIKTMGKQKRLVIHSRKPTFRITL